MILPPDGKRFPMKFRLVWVGSDEGGSEQPRVKERFHAQIGVRATRRHYTSPRAIAKRPAEVHSANELYHPDCQ